MEDLAAAVAQLGAEARSAEAQWEAGRTDAEFEDCDGARYRIVVVQGDGGHFCSGADLGMLGDLHGASEGAEGEALREFGRWMNGTMTSTLTALRRLPQVSVAIVQGAAFGGGAELTTATDLRLVSSDAVIRFVQATMARAEGLGLADATFEAPAPAQAPAATEASDAPAAEEGCPGCADGCCRLPPGALATLPRLVAPAAPVSSLAASKAAIPAAEPLPEEAAAFLRVWGARAQQDVLARLRK
ncbi:hypothetical protein FNF28_01718 [Cafeteria roenbergensis]|uniref:Ethylmalonyl-CoA decarboxylase n=1 Tax=Cafeteria roenbergensis TaxID=33653 RepID=A0A5A8DXI8_CAFRO|nr:hypothetical protein FNF28_01718 [Cafeteria roenbergensis]